MRIDENGRLVVNFRTDAQFRGLFVPDHPATDMQSSVTSSDHPGLTYTLNLLRSDPTFAQPEQLWQFVSDHAVSLFIFCKEYEYNLKDNFLVETES